MKSSLTSAVIAIVALIVGLTRAGSVSGASGVSELHSTAAAVLHRRARDCFGGKGRGSDRPVQKCVCDRTRQSRI